MWALKKVDIHICFPHRSEEGRGDGYSWSFVIEMGLEEGVWKRGAWGGGIQGGVGVE